MKSTNSNIKKEKEKKKRKRKEEKYSNETHAQFSVQTPIAVGPNWKLKVNLIMGPRLRE